LGENYKSALEAPGLYMGDFEEYAVRSGARSSGDEHMERLTDRYARAVVLIRVLVGWVFLSEGIQKFLFPAALGVGRFEKIGIPSPHVMAPFVGVVEIVCGTLLLVGLLTRLATVPLLIDMVVALITTKFVLLAKSGLWSTLHEARVDVSMVLGLIFLLMVGGGAWSLDARFASRRVDGGLGDTQITDEVF
jgi:putative oxidoreductase